MDIFGIKIPYKPLTNFELCELAKKLQLNIRGVFMRDTLPIRPNKIECGIVNFNKSTEIGSHWVCYFKDNDYKVYFDSFGQIILHEVRDYLKGSIYRNTDIVQPPNSPICGHLSLYVLKALSNGMTFRDTLNSLEKSGNGVKWTSSLANELHFPLRKNFPKRYVFVRNAGEIYGADLVDMRALSKENDGFKYILMVIDIFSKFGWAVPIKFKTGEAVKNALEKIFREKKGAKIWADFGREFYNKKVKDMLKRRDISLYSTENEEKCSVIERWNRTIKSQLWKYFTANSTHKYIDILPDLINKYNHTKHRSIQMTPIEAEKKQNRARVFRHLYTNKMKAMGEQKPKFKVGDKVRLAVKKDKFEKSYVINWSDRLYFIKQALATRPLTYIVEDDQGNQHKGTFYEQELQHVKTDLFRVEKILKYKTEGGIRYGYVKWIDYDNSYNTWIPVNDLIK